MRQQRHTDEWSNSLALRWYRHRGVVVGACARSQVHARQEYFKKVRDPDGHTEHLELFC